VEPAVIEEVRLTRFKSFHGAVLPLDALTLLVGRNGSGKSNALDGLWVLARLAHGEDIRDAIDGGREGPAVRGGVLGCAPFGESSFTLGCSVRAERTLIRLDVTIQVEPVVQIVWERLRVGGKTVLETDAANAESSDITATWSNRSPGRNPKLSFRAGSLLSSQVASRIPTSVAGDAIHYAADQLLGALRDVFVLDPVPHEMRQYVPRRDYVLRRNANNISAAAATLLESPASKNLLRLALGDLNEQDISDIRVSSSQLDDVILTLVESQDGHPHTVSARLMSDGSLRFLAVLVALMQAPKAGRPAGGDLTKHAAQTTLVIEELENGLHASQAENLVKLMRDQVHSRRIRVLATAHSPALLDALVGDEHRSVIICQRDKRGLSTLARLVDLPDYFNIVAGGSLGRAAIGDRLRESEYSGTPSTFLDGLLGGSVP